MTDNFQQFPCFLRQLTGPKSCVCNPIQLVANTNLNADVDIEKAMLEICCIYNIHSLQDLQSKNRTAIRDLCDKLKWDEDFDKMIIIIVLINIYFKSSNCVL